MEQPKGHPCPECGAPREPDGTPSCACGRRAAEALREARTAQAAAAEDFTPLRIRPYVELETGPKDGEPVTGTGNEDDGGARTGITDGAAAAPADSETTMLLSAPVKAATTAPPAATTAPPAAPEEPRDTPAEARPTTPSPSAPAEAGATMSLRRVAPGAAPPEADAASVLPTPLAPPAGRPRANDLRLFEPAAGTGTVSGPGTPDGGAPDPYGAEDGGPRRRRRGTLLAAALAVVAVVAAAGYATGLFAYETPSRDESLPDGVRVSVPATSASAAPTAPAPSTTSAAPASTAPSVSADASASPSPSPSASSGSPTPSPSAEPSKTPTSAQATSSAAETYDDRGEEDTAVLRRGDRGAEVTELQLRLNQLHLYMGQADGTFNRQVENAVRTFQWARGIRTDEPGVYGQATRRQLETETSQP
ncbi:peptidoglycan-binding protein [Streptomyces fumigatiscleroticus]|nr:peptidoglycan-binding protein [Streptomyces fumigatiscleroticus]